MFVKASGPVVFSDTSESEMDGEDNDMEDNSVRAEDVIKFSKDSDSEDQCNEDDEQPNKKKKMS